MTRRLARAAQAFEDFTGHKARKVTKTQLQAENAAGWRMGPTVGIAYEATRDGRTQQYFHEFERSARPDLVSRDDGKQLFLTGGRYTVTERGIEDMPQLFVVNPSARRAKAKRKPAPMAAARRKAPKKRAKSTSRQVAIFRANPAPKRRRRAAPAKAAVKRRFKRNPSGRGMMRASAMIVPAMGVGLGAVGTELIMGYLPIPAGWKMGVMRQVTKGAVGVAAGYVLSKFLKQKKLGGYVMAGAVVIATHDAIKELIASRMPGVNTSGFGQYMDPLPSQFGGMGYLNPAQLGQYVQPLPSQFAGMSQAYDAPGGETDYRA